MAKSKYIRIGPRKIDLVAKAILGMKIGPAIEALKNLDKKAARFLLLVLKQGVGNAVNNYQLSKESLRIKRIEIGKGPIFKRGKPVSRGQWHEIMSRTSHIRVVLEGEPGVVKKTETKKGAPAFAKATAGKASGTKG